MICTLLKKLEKCIHLTKKIHFVRQLIDLKMSTQRDLMTMSSDLNQSGKKMTSGKAIVYIDFFMWFFNNKKFVKLIIHDYSLFGCLHSFRYH